MQAGHDMDAFGSHGRDDYRPTGRRQAKAVADA
jgi:hypothetical protein